MIGRRRASREGCQCASSRPQRGSRLKCQGLLGLTLIAVIISAFISACGRTGSTATAPTSPQSPQIAVASPQTSPTPQPRCNPTSVSEGKFGTLKSNDGSRLPVVDMGSGPTVAVFVHQTDGDGYCGFWQYARWLTHQGGVRAVLFDLCNYGSAACTDGPFSDNQISQVKLAIAHARAMPGVRRVVLVGASMGGAVAFAAAAEDHHVQAVVDLSGPPKWIGAEAAKAAPTLHVPCLVAASPHDSSADYDGIRAAYASVKASPKRFVIGDGSHGWDLLGKPDGWTPLATITANWVRGDYYPAAR